MILDALSEGIFGHTKKGTGDGGEGTGNNRGIGFQSVMNSDLCDVILAKAGIQFWLMAKSFSETTNPTNGTNRNLLPGGHAAVARGFNPWKGVSHSHPPSRYTGRPSSKYHAGRALRNLPSTSIHGNREGAKRLLPRIRNLL
jgi:hypothetical protein